MQAKLLTKVLHSAGQPGRLGRAGARSFQVLEYSVPSHLAGASVPRAVSLEQFDATLATAFPIVNIIATRPPRSDHQATVSSAETVAS